VHLLQVYFFKTIHSTAVPNKCCPIPRSTPHPLLHSAPVLSFAFF
jgi:hypothetical protein